MRWTSKEEEYLLKNYFLLPIEEIEKELKRSRSAIYSKVAVLKRKNRRFLERKK